VAGRAARERRAARLLHLSRLRNPFEFFGVLGLDDEHYGINPGYSAYEAQGAREPLREYVPVTPTGAS
jgi:hypothetical protein